LPGAGRFRLEHVLKEEDHLFLRYVSRRE
jgi:hypothetical protein